MKRGFLILVLCTVVLYPAFVQAAIPGLSPKNARSMGMGGTFRVFSSGYESFFGNPAAFAGKGSLTIADASAWGYIRASDISGLINVIPSSVSQSDRKDVVETLIRRNGFGAGASTGLGWAGNGFGLGLTVVSDAYAKGETYDSAAIEVRNQANVVFGLAWPLDLGAFKFRFGFDVRAFYRLDSLRTWPFADIATSLFTWNGFWDQIGAQTVRGGYGITVDTGAILEFGPLSMGITVRDYGYRFSMDDTMVSRIVGLGALPMSGEIDCALTPVYTGGLALKFKPAQAVDASFFAEADDPIGTIPLIFSDLGNALGYFHAGAEFKLFSFLALRAGYNHGLLSLGSGLDLALLEIDAAIFTEPASGIAESDSRTGLSLQAAFRF